MPDSYTLINAWLIANQRAQYATITLAFWALRDHLIEQQGRPLTEPERMEAEEYLSIWWHRNHPDYVTAN